MNDKKTRPCALFCGLEEEPRKKRRHIFGEGGEGKGVKYFEKENMFLWWRRRIEKEKKKNI